MGRLGEPRLETYGLKREGALAALLAYSAHAVEGRAVTYYRLWRAWAAAINLNVLRASNRLPSRVPFIGNDKAVASISLSRRRTLIGGLKREIYYHNEMKIKIRRHAKSSREMI